MYYVDSFIYNIYGRVEFIILVRSKRKFNDGLYLRIQKRLYTFIYPIFLY